MNHTRTIFILCLLSLLLGGAMWLVSWPVRPLELKLVTINAPGGMIPDVQMGGGN